MTVIEITLTGGQQVRVAADVKTVESAILAAARGSIMEFAWVTDVKTDQAIGLNPDHVLMLRVLEPD